MRPALKAALSEYDQYVRACPIRNPKRGHAYATYDKCARCGARADQNCSLEATASYHLVRAIRRIAGADDES